MRNHQIIDPAAARIFVTAGRARFTIVSRKTGTRFTYRVRVAADSRLGFVSVLTGSDNENAYEFLGTIFPTGYRHGRRSRISAGSPCAIAFGWLYKALDRGVLPASVEFWHEGRCGRCGRALTVPQSIATGFGPECADILGRAHALDERTMDDMFARQERRQEERGFLSDPDFVAYAKAHDARPA